MSTTTSLPPPQTFDLIPPLHALLSRLLPDSTTPISPKELGTAASAIKIKIQRARVAVEELPAVEMSLEEQEEVIAELEEEVRRLDGVLEGIGAMARGVLREERGGEGMVEGGEKMMEG